MPPRTRAGSQVPPTGIPLSISQGIVVGSTQVLDPATPLVLGAFAFAGIFIIEIEIPELKFGFTRGSNSGEYDVTSSW